MSYPFEPRGARARKFFAINLDFIVISHTLIVPQFFFWKNQSLGQSRFFRFSLTFCLHISTPIPGSALSLNVSNHSKLAFTVFAFSKFLFFQNICLQPQFISPSFKIAWYRISQRPRWPWERERISLSSFYGFFKYSFYFIFLKSKQIAMVSRVFLLLFTTTAVISTNVIAAGDDNFMSAVRSLIYGDQVSCIYILSCVWCFYSYWLVFLF